jgi:hypothetical protein
VFVYHKHKNSFGYAPLSAAILAQWRHPVASTKALDLLHQAMRVILYRRTARAIKMASKKLVHFAIVVMFAVAPAAAGAIQIE